LESTHKSELNDVLQSVMSIINPYCQNGTLSGSAHYGKSDTNIYSNVRNNFIA